MKRIAKAHWAGKLESGNGNLTTESGILSNTNYTYKMRFGDQPGTNPEELLAAAHAGCFTMAVSLAVTKRGYDPEFLDTTATVTMENLMIKQIHLDISGSVPGLNDEEFHSITEDAKKNCIISKAISAPITSESHLVVTSR